MARSISVTVASVIERDGRFLFVEEETDEGVRINQPAGHLEHGESIADGAARETLEETAYRFTPTALVGVYHWPHPAGTATYVRFAFCGELGQHEADRKLDQGILRALWLTPAELNALAPRHRNPLVRRCVDDYLAGRRYPLNLITRYP